MSQPLLLGWVVGYVSGESALPPMHAYLYGFGLCCMLLLHGVLGAAYLFVTQRVALKMKTALEALLYRKVVSLSCKAALLTSPAIVVEQFSTNTDVFAEVRGISLFLFLYFYLKIYLHIYFSLLKKSLIIMIHVHCQWVGPIQVFNSDDMLLLFL